MVGRRSCAMILLALFGSQLSAHINYDFSVSSTRFFVNEPLSLSVTATNDSAQPVTLMFWSGLQMAYELDMDYWIGDSSTLAPTEAVVPANGTYQWEMLHDWSDNDLKPGDHSAIGMIGPLEGYWESAPLPFTLGSAPLPTEDVFIDFETYPDGTTTSDFWEKSYSSLGVEFSSNLGSSGSTGLSFGNTDGNTFLRDNVSADGTFNIFADLEIPVTEVSVDVGSAAGVSVTMIAYDDSGAEIGSATSDPMDSVLDFKPLSLEASKSISRLEWLPSSNSAGVQIDDLDLKIEYESCELPASYLAGDANLDGFVDVSDLNIWNDHKFTNNANWCDGDFNMDGGVDVQDFNIWNDHKFTSSPSTVPEPSARILILGLMALVAVRVRKGH